MYKQHNITDIEGIGDNWAASLRSKGVLKTEDLLKHDIRLLKNEISRLKKFPTAKLEVYISCARLMQIIGLNGQHAEALTKAGISTLLKLSLPAPEKLVLILDEAKSEGLIPESIELDTAINWQKEALKIKYQNCVYGKVENLDGPIKGAIVRCQGLSAETDANGEYWLPKLSSRMDSIFIEKEGFDSSLYSVNIKDKVNRCDVVIEPQTEIKTADEAHGEIVTINDPSEIKFVKRPIDDFLETTPFRLERFYQNGNAKLVSLHKQRKGPVVEVGYTEVPLDKIHGSPSVGEMLIKIEGDEFELSPMTIRDYKLNKYYEDCLAKIKLDFKQFIHSVHLRKSLIQKKLEEKAHV